MMNLVKEGKLQDVIIPSGFVLPHAYLERVENAIAENTKNRFNEDNGIINVIKISGKQEILFKKLSNIKF